MSSNFLEKKIIYKSTLKLIISILVIIYSILMTLLIFDESRCTGSIAARIIFLLCMVPPALIPAMIGFVRGILPLINVNNYFEIRKLLKKGYPDFILHEIEDQIKNTENAAYILSKRDIIYFTKDWVIIESAFNIKLFRATEIIWAFKDRYSIRHKYGDETIEYRIDIRNKKDLAHATGDEAKVDELLSIIAYMYPWVVLGYSDELDKMWRKDKERFIAYFESQKNNPSA